MDSLIAAAARALAAGDALGALKRIALRDDPPALALRGTAMAQLGEHPRARCVVAEAEVALEPYRQRMRLGRRTARTFPLPPPPA